MIAPLLLLLGAFFAYRVFTAWTTGEIVAKGWGWQMRTYDREEEPVMFWMNFVTYVVIVVWTTAFDLPSSTVPSKKVRTSPMESIA